MFKFKESLRNYHCPLFYLVKKINSWSNRWSTQIQPVWREFPVIFSAVSTPCKHQQVSKSWNASCFFITSIPSAPQSSLLINTHRHRVITLCCNHFGFSEVFSWVDFIVKFKFSNFFVVSVMFDFFFEANGLYILFRFGVVKVELPLN